MLTNGLGDIAHRVGGSVAFLELGQRPLPNRHQVIVVAQVGSSVSIGHQEHLPVGVEGDVCRDLIRNGGIVLG